MEQLILAGGCRVFPFLAPPLFPSAKQQGNADPSPLIGRGLFFYAITRACLLYLSTLNIPAREN